MFRWILSVLRKIFQKPRPVFATVPQTNHLILPANFHYKTLTEWIKELFALNPTKEFTSSEVTALVMAIPGHSHVDTGVRSILGSLRKDGYVSQNWVGRVIHHKYVG